MFSMFPLIKQNLLLSVLSYIFVLMMIALAHITVFPPIFSFIVITLSLLITLYYYDDKNKVNHFLISLPVTKEKIVQSRYVTIALLSITLLFFQWFMMALFSSSSHYVYDWRDIITVFGMTLIMTAIYIPIYYVFSSPHIATGLIIILFFIGVVAILDPLITVLGMVDYIIFNDLDAGFSLLVEKNIPFQPYFTFAILSLILFYCSMILSQKIFSSKDQ